MLDDVCFHVECIPTLIPCWIQPDKKQFPINDSDWHILASGAVPLVGNCWIRDTNNFFKQWFLCQCCEKYEKLIPAYNSNQHIPASAALTRIDWGSSMFSHNIFPSKWCLSVGCLVALTNVEDRFWLTHSSKFYPSWKFIHGGSGHSLIFVQVAFNIKNIFPRKWCLSVGCLVKVIKIGKRFRLTHPSKLCPSLNPLDQNWPQGPVVWWKPLVQQRDRMESRLTMCEK